MKYFIPALLVCNFLALTLVVSLFFVNLNKNGSDDKAWEIPFGEPTLVELPSEVKTAPEPAPQGGAEGAEGAEEKSPAPVEVVSEVIPPPKPATPPISIPSTTDPVLAQTMKQSDRPFLDMEKELFPHSEPIRNQFETPVFKRRLPSHFKTVGVTEEQVAEIYRIQEDYFNQIVFLQMRIDRLAKERDEAIFQILTEEQQTNYKTLKEAKKNRVK